MDINAITTKCFPQWPYNLIRMVIVGCTDAINVIFGSSSNNSDMAFFIARLMK